MHDKARIDGNMRGRRQSRYYIAESRRKTGLYPDTTEGGGLRSIVSERSPGQRTPLIDRFLHRLGSKKCHHYCISLLGSVN